jgi:hypothetical protein
VAAWLDVRGRTAAAHVHDHRTRTGGTSTFLELLVTGVPSIVLDPVVFTVTVDGDIDTANNVAMDPQPVNVPVLSTAGLVVLVAGVVLVGLANCVRRSARA